MRSLLVCFFALFIQPAFGKEVEIVVNVPFNTPSEKIYLTGNVKELCHWKVRCLPMQKVSGHSYRASFEVSERLAELEFKITRGSWESEAGDAWANRLSNYKLVLATEKTTEIVSVANWKDRTPFGPKGHIQVIENFWSSTLGEGRRISVWRPKIAKERPLPVIYMHDGQNAFDPGRSTFGMEWNIDEQLASLIEEGVVPPAMIVAIDSHPEGRYEDYDWLRNGHRHAKFIVSELKPFIDANFATHPQRESTYLLGSSMGAYISLAILTVHSKTFSKASGLSFPAFAHDRAPFSFLERFTQIPTDVAFFMDHGDTGGDARYAPSAEDFYARLIKLGMPARNLVYRTYPFAAHTELDWSRRLSDHLRFLLNAQ